MNITLIYPPTVTGTYEVIHTTWSSSLV